MTWVFVTELAACTLVSPDSVRVSHFPDDGVYGVDGSCSPESEKMILYLYTPSLRGCEGLHTRHLRPMSMFHATDMGLSLMCMTCRVHMDLVMKLSLT